LSKRHGGGRTEKVNYVAAVRKSDMSFAAENSASSAPAVCEEVKKDICPDSVESV
jgi:hypothetical protein